MTDTIDEIRARHEALASQLDLRTTGIFRHEGNAAHADRAEALAILAHIERMVSVRIAQLAET